MAIKFVLNNKTIWDNTDFENILFSDLLDQTDSYLHVRQINNEVVTVGGWRIDVQSTINWNATSEDVIDGYNKLSTKLGLNVNRSFLPFFTADIWNYRSEEEAQKARAYDEPMVLMFLRLCYWYHKCDIISASLKEKHKEIRNKLKVSGALINVIRTSGFDNALSREWIRQAIGVIYELICASVSHHYDHYVSFEKDHDFIFEEVPAEVKTKFPPVDAHYGEEFYPVLNLSLTSRDADLNHVLKEAIKMPEIMDNNLKDAIDRQGAGIVFLNLILENKSSVLTFLSEHEGFELTLEKAIDDSSKLLNDKSYVPLIVSFHAVHCSYTIFACMIPVPISKKNGKSKIDITRL
jgi:hypothetical protein